MDELEAYKWTAQAIHDINSEISKLASLFEKYEITPTS